jgi:hypothetical protein
VGDIGINSVRSPALGEWESAWLATPFATYFQSPWWFGAWRSQSPGEWIDATFVATFTDGMQAVVPVGVERRARGLLRVAHLSPAGTWGGPLMIGGGPQHRQLIAELILERFPNVNWLPNPFEPVVEVEMFEGWPRESTLVIDLSAGPDSVARAWSKGHRSAIAQAGRRGVTTVLASTEFEWRSYFAAYQDSLRRWGSRASSSYPWQLFDALRIQPSSLVRLWLARHENSIVSGAVCFYHKDVVNLWHAATFEAAFPLRPAHLVVSEAVRHAMGEGHSIFDLGPSGGHHSVEHFKRGFSPQRTDAPVIMSRSRSYSAARLVVHALRRRQVRSG